MAKLSFQYNATSNEYMINMEGYEGEEDDMILCMQKFIVAFFGSLKAVGNMMESNDIEDAIRELMRDDDSET